MDPIQTTADKNGTLNAITGTLGKAFDTFLDTLAISGANKLIGTQYPTGQESPEAVASRLKAEQATAAAKPFNWQPLAIGGGLFVAAIVAIAVLRK
jgi:hypothetical protein